MLRRGFVMSYCFYREERHMIEIIQIRENTAYIFAADDIERHYIFSDMLPYRMIYAIYASVL